VRTTRFSLFALLTVALNGLVPIGGASALPTSPLVAAAAPPTCDMTGYKSASGLTATVDQGVLTIAWNGQAGARMRARYAIENGTPIVRELAAKKSGGQWGAVGRNLTPEYHVVTGVRRLGMDQAGALRSAGIELTEGRVNKERWNAFWDAPLVLPDGRELKDEAAWRRSQQGGGGGGEGVGGGRDGGRGTERGARPAAIPTGAGRAYGPARTPAEIKRADASFNVNSCKVKTDGSSLEVTFPGLTMASFSGDLRFTVYRGTNLLRMDAVAKTNEQWIAYKYDGGLRGFSTDLTPVVSWRDTGGHTQQHRFGGATNESIVKLKAANRLLVAGGRTGSLATFPPPHTFFFTREKDTNLGYVWYRKDAAGRFGIGVDMPEREEDPQYVQNFALYNAPPGTMQRMGIYFYLSPEGVEPTREAVMAFTHNDTFKPVAGYKTMVNHFHLDFTGRLRTSGSLDTQIQDLAAMKSLGLNIIGLSDFHFELARTDPGPLRFKDQKDYFEGTRKASDEDFLVTPWEEPSAFFGGHYNILWPKRIYWSKVRTEGQRFTETDPVYGKVYHTGSAEDVQKMMDAEGAYWYHAHPRTKGTTAYPDLIFGKPYVKNDRYLGVAFKPGMGQDNSEARLCEWRCFDSVDTMNNMYANTGIAPKYIIADIDTYRKGPEDDLYPNFPVNYIRMDRVPGPDEDWSPILKALRNGDFFVTTGEILIKSYKAEGAGAKQTLTADVEWTFPLSFVEVVWGDGKKIDRQIVPATDTGAFGAKKFAIPFDPAGKAWVRFAVWDSAGNGAFVQPIWVSKLTRTTTSK
jgi:hypothetical protein